MVLLGQGHDCHLDKVRIGENIPPTAAIIATPEGGEPALEVHFDGSGSVDLDGVIENYEWDY